MLDHMSMPVLFVLVFMLLLLVGGGLFVAVRVFGAHQRSAPGSTEPDALPRERV